MRRTGIVMDNRYMEHDMGAYHPENPRRLEVIYSMLEDADIKGRFHKIEPRSATKEEICYVHSQDYVDMIADTRGKSHVMLDPDTSTCARSYEVAMLAAGGLCEAIRAVVEKKIDNAFALVRPPGHHAERDRAMGFCLFNNIAIGARYAQKTHAINKVLIVDWDLHHGNGTQHSFEDDASVLYFSTHQYPYYPGTGAFEEVGIGEGKGFTINVPLSHGFGDAEYSAIYNMILKPIATEFKPDLVLISAGFDIYKDDPLGGMSVTPQGFAAITRIVMNIADECCNGRLAITLEGGYNLNGLRDSVKAVLKELSDMTNTDPDEIAKGSNKQMLSRVIERLGHIQGNFWKRLSDAGF